MRTCMRTRMTSTRALLNRLGLFTGVAAFIALSACPSDDTTGTPSGNVDVTNDEDTADAGGVGDTSTADSGDQPDSAIPDGSTSGDTASDAGGDTAVTPDVQVTDTGSDAGSVTDTEDTGSEDDGDATEPTDAEDAGDVEDLPCEEKNKCIDKGYFPLCCDGVDYANDCFAQCGGISLQDLLDGKCLLQDCAACVCEAPPPNLDCGPDAQYCDKADQTYTDWCDFSCANEGVEALTFKNCGPCKSACNCGKQDWPVCGTDGKTYPNSCHVQNTKCSEATLACAGNCPSDFAGNPACAGCSTSCAPVCGWGMDNNVKSYRNDCFATCEGAMVFSNATCPECEKDLAPVCGTDFKTYPNQCFSAAVGVAVLYDDVCVCKCDMNQQDPVCGVDGLTYPNPCAAECFGIMQYTPGPC